MRPAMICMLCVTTSAMAQPVFDWLTVGDPGNRPTTEAEGGINAGFGSVSSAFRMTRTEITVNQHFAFIQAARPFYDFGSISADNVWFGHAIGIRPGTNDPYIAPGWENSASSMSAFTAARYCNWLHNGMVSEAWAFESGAYDMSRIGQTGPDGNAYQLIRSEGARFWIANLDEWIKAMYWDPTKGEDGGYWRFQHRSDEPPVPGAPSEPGAESSGGNIPINAFGPSTGPVDVGSYPDAASYYGMLDGSGGMMEWLETHPDDVGPRFSAATAGSGRAPDDVFWLSDDISLIGWSRSPTLPHVGLRLASAIPCLPDLAPPTGTLNAADLIAYLDLYHASDPAADLADPLGTLNFFDLAAYLQAFIAGCP